MAQHELKTWPEFFSALVDMRKQFEVRRDDREFHVGDTLLLREYNPVTETYTGKELARHVTYILRDPALGVRPGFVVMSLM